MTKKEMFTTIASRLADDAEIVAFCEHEIELLSRKRGSSKPTKVQIANEAIKTEILEVLADAENPMTVKEITSALEGEYTSQKISALLRQLKEAEKVVKTYERKVAYFAVA